MSYIGREPITGNFVKLDAISVVNGQASYTMQNGGENFTAYETVNQFLVSLNGILQSPVDSFTVSSSTITFASNLVTGDVIDFIMVLGNTLDIGTPSDNTVSLAKLTATGTKDATTFLRGDNTFASAGGDMTPAFSAERSSSLTLNDNTFTDVIFDTEILDTDSAFNTSTGVFTVPTGKGGKYFIGINLMFGDNEGNASDWIGNLIINASSNYLIRYESTSNGNTFTQVTNSWSLILNLSAGDTLKVQGLCDTNDSSSGTLVGGNFKTSFMGYKIIE